MKLKYHMRGLGIGIILTTLILTISNANNKISDKEIMKRAKALGMVMENDDNYNLDNELNPTGTPVPSITITAKPTASPTVMPTDQPTTVPTVIPTDKPTDKPTTVPAKEPTKTPTKAPTKAPTKDTSAAATTISFTIQKGMSSNRVAQLLVEKGLIKDADDFNQYIIKVGKASVICVGDYSLKQGATYDDIIKKITSK